MVAFVLEIGSRLQEAVVASVLIVTVGGYLGAWRRDRAPRRSFGALVFGDDGHGDGRDASGQPSEPD